MDYKEIAEILREGAKRMDCSCCTMHWNDTPECVLKITAEVIDRIAAEDSDNLIPDTFGFDEAIKQLKRGAKLCRKGWNGKNQFIVLAHDITYKTKVCGEFDVIHEDIGSQAVAFHGTRGIQIGWLASQADMLAEDWMIWRADREQD